MSHPDGFRPELLRGNPKIVVANDGGSLRRILNGRHIKPVGYYPSFKGGQSLPVEADHEQGLLEHSDADAAVVRVLTQPHRVEIPVLWQRRPLTYFPDVRRDLADGTVEICETKRENDRRLKDPDYSFKLEVVKLVYARQGWKFRLLKRDEILSGRLYDNVQDISRWANTKTPTGARFALEEAIERAGGSLALGRASEIVGGIERIYALIVRRVVFVDLKRQVNTDAPVSCVDHEALRRSSPLSSRCTVPVSLDIKINDVIVREERLFRYALEMPGDRMLFLPLHVGDGAEFTCSEADYEKMLLAREVKPHVVIRDAEGNIIREEDANDPAPYCEEGAKIKKARSLFHFLKLWHQNPTSLYHPALDNFVARHRREAKQQGYEWAPSAGVMHRAINAYPDITQLTARFLVSRSGQTQRERWHPRVALLLERLIDFYWEKDTRQRNYLDAYSEFDRWYEALADELSQTVSLLEPLKRPSDETLRAYINSAECFETWARKYSDSEADARFQGNVHPIAAKRLLDVVLIDSTIVDTWCVLDDETLLPLGRPTLTIAIDLFTRMILAVVVTYEPPSLYTAMACLKRINMPKHDVNARWPEIRRVSDGWGKPTMAVVDNELAQIGKSYQAAAEDAKILIRWAPVKRPQYKAVVERFFLTLKFMLFDKLPGGLPYKPAIMSQLGIDPSEVATITLSKLTELINMTINDVYHYKEHSTIGMAPARAWEVSKRKWKRPYIGDVDFLDKAFGALDDAVLTTSGIRFDNMQFHDPVVTRQLLDDLAFEEPKRKRRRSKLATASIRVMFKYNPADISKINVWNKIRKMYVRLVNVAGDAALGLSKWHWRILKIWAELENVAFSTPSEQLAARRKLREEIERTIPHEAYKTIKHQRRLLHDPSKVVEGSVVLMTQATPSVSGMGPDDIEIEVNLNAPEGDRIPPKGPDRGHRRGKPRSRSKLANASSESTPSPEPIDERMREALIAAFEEDVRPATPASPPKNNTDTFDTAFDAVIRRHQAQAVTSHD